MRVQHGAQVAEPHEDAIVAAPGMTLAEVKAELARAEHARQSAMIAEPVRAAFEDEAADIIEEEEIVFVEPPPSSASRSTSSSPSPSEPAASPPPEQTPRPEPHTRRRHQRRTSKTERAGDGAARRIVYLRDDRRNARAATHLPQLSRARDATWSCVSSSVSA